jgi:hypothetical protein
MTGTVTVSGGNLSKTISFTSPTFFLPLTSGGKSYSLAVFGDADQFSTLTNALNSTQPLYIQAVYLLNSVLNPTTYPVNAIEVEDATGNLVTSPTQLIADTFIWAYSYVNQSQLAQPCALLDQAYQGRSLQSLGINLVTGLEWADFASTIASDITTALGPDDAAAFASSVSLFQDILGGWSALSSDAKVNAPTVVSQLETLGLISKSSGNNYTAAEVLTNLASLDPSGLGSVVSSLYGSAYGKTISSKASSYAQTFWGQFVTGVEQSLVPSALAGGYAFYETYGVYELTAATSAGIAASSFATAAAGGLVNAASAAVIQGFLVPLKDLLQAESSIESSANSICSGSTAVFTPVQSGSANIDSAGAYAATSGFVYALLASWFAYDAQLNKGEQSGAYTFSDVLSFLGSSLATEFQMSAQQEASYEGFDETSAPIAEGWTNAIGALFKASTSAANSLVNAAACGVPGTSIISLSNQNMVFQTPVAVGSRSTAQTVTLSNAGTVILTITGMPMGGANPGDFLVSNNCGGSVPAGANCTISITFAPAGTGTRTAGINVTSNASNSPQNVALTGTGSSGTAPQPTITSLSPASAQAGSSAQVLTINGTGFTPSSTVTFHGVSHAATFINSGQLTITLSASDLATAGSFPVVMTNPAPGGGTSAPVSFTVQAQAPITITAVSKVIAQSDPPIIITGSGFGTFPYPLPASLPYYPSILYSWSPLAITNNSQNWRAGGPWDACTLALSQWSDSSVSLVADVNEGFGLCPLAVGDQLTISIWNPESSGPSTCAPSGDTVIGQCATVTVTVAAH